MIDWRKGGEILSDFYKNAFLNIFLHVQYNESFMCKLSEFTFIYFFRQ